MNEEQKLEKKADALFKKAVLARDRYCKVCGISAGDAHHIIPRSKSNFLRHDILNGIALCRNCHRKVEDRNPFAIAKLSKKLDSRVIDYLETHKSKLIKYNVEYLKCRIEELKKECRRWGSHQKNH